MIKSISNQNKIESYSSYLNNLISGKIEVSGLKSIF